MKHTMSHSRASGAVIIFAMLCLGVCFFDGTWLAKAYSSYVQPYTSPVNKTHFIIGSGDQQPSAGAPEAPVQSMPVYSQVLFSPDDNIQQELLTLIRQEKQRIRVAIFTFTDTDIAQALIDAFNRGVRVEIVADTGYLRDQYSKIPLLQHNKIPVFTYNPHYKNVRQKKKDLLSIMHHKFMVFEKNKDDQSLVASGSYNLTRAAHMRNQEAITISNDRGVIEKFKHQFERLKKRCDDNYEEVQNK